METLTTNGIKVSVEIAYQPSQSKPTGSQHIFGYRITIENVGNHRVQLISRHWYIFDANGVKKEVKGDGVIGQQPILDPGQSHQYTSWCPLTSEIGKMYGTYTMIRKADNQEFLVRVPEFHMVAPAKLN